MPPPPLTSSSAAAPWRPSTPSTPWAEALAIADGWIVAVGSDEELGAYIGTETEVVELNGRFVAPGFIEGHGHYMSLGNSKTILDLKGAANWDAIVEMVAEASATARSGQWIRGRGLAPREVEPAAGSRR